MARSPIYDTQTRLRWSEVWVDDANKPVDLTNPDTSAAVITLRILWPDGTPHDGTGTGIAVDMKNGKFKWKVIPGDFPAVITGPTIYFCQYIATWSNNEKLDGDLFQITALKGI